MKFAIAEVTFRCHSASALFHQTKTDFIKNKMNRLQSVKFFVNFGFCSRVTVIKASQYRQSVEAIKW